MNKHTIEFEFKGRQLEIRLVLNNETWEAQVFCDNKPLLEKPYSVSNEDAQDAYSVRSILSPLAVSLMESLKSDIEEEIIELSFPKI